MKRRKTPVATVYHDETLLRLDTEASLYRGLVSGSPYPFPAGNAFAQRIAADAGSFCELQSLADKRAVPLDDGRPQHYLRDGGDDDMVYGDDETPASTDTASIGLAILGTTPIGHPIHAPTADDPTVEIDSDPRTQPTGDTIVCTQ